MPYQRTARNIVALADSSNISKKATKIKKVQSDISTSCSKEFNSRFYRVLK